MSRYIPHDAYQLSIKQIDEIVDEIRKNKYSKNPPSLIQVLSTGLCPENIEIYSKSRWPELTKTGITMRVNKLSERISAFRSKMSEIKKIENAAWKIHVPYELHYEHGVPHIMLVGNYENVKSVYEFMLKPFCLNESPRISFCCLASKEATRSMNEDFFKMIRQSYSAIDKKIETLKERKTLFEGLEFSLENSFEIT
jgi:hypothetical protein